MRHPTEYEALAGECGAWRQDCLEVSTPAGPLRLECWAGGMFRLRLGNTAVHDYGLVLGQKQELAVERAEKAVSLQQEEGVVESREYTLSHKGVSVVLGLSPLTLELRCEGKPLLPVTEDAHFGRRFRLPPFTRTEDGWFVTLGLPFGEAVYGGGEQFGPLNRRGTRLDMWNLDALGVNSERSYKNCPFVWSPEGWGLFVNTPGMVRLGAGYAQWSNQSLCLDVRDELLDIFFFAADSPALLLEKYTWLTGRSAQAPLWSLGVWLSKAYYRTPDETLEAARSMREKNMPCDVITLDGRAWQDTRTRFLFEFDPARYSDPKAFCDQLKALDFRICAWEYPLVSINNPRYAELAEKGYFLRDAEGKPAVYNWPTSIKEKYTIRKVLTPLPPSSLIDFTNPEAWNFWKDMHKEVFAAGVDCMKPDFSEQVLPEMFSVNGDSGERIHNVYTLLYNLCVYEASREYFGENAFVWSRSGWAGSQRAPMQWAGDTQSSWSGLAASILGGLSWGMSGCPYYSHDIGGFYGEQPGAELFVRWTQASVFASHIRFHGVGAREPWAFGPEAENICRQWLELRYRLLPYVNAACAESARNGLPVLRAMPLAFPEERTLHGFEMQYMLGEDIFVAPVVEAGGTAQFRLPGGVWYDFWTGLPREGSVTLCETLPLNRIPVYVRKGTLLPLGPVVQHTGQIDPARPVEALLSYGAPVSATAGLELPVLTAKEAFGHM